MLALADAIDMGLALVDSDGRIRLVNAWMRQHAQFGEEPCGRTLTEAFGAGVDPHLLRAVDSALRQGLASRLSNALHPAPLPLFASGTSPDVRIHQGIDVKPFDEDGRRLCLIQVRDVSEAIKRERLLRAQARQLGIDLEKIEEAQRILQQRTDEAEAANRSRNVFLSVVTHELRTPLHTILGYADLIRRQLPAGPLLDQMDMMEGSGRQLMRIIDDILEFSRGETSPDSLHARPFQLPELLERVAGYGRMHARRADNRFRLELATAVPECVEGDEQRLTQVLNNLIDNACKFTERGDIVLDVRCTPANNAAFSDLVFTLDDSGPGIGDDEAERIFAPFYRRSASRYQPGLGLGLSIARQIVERMHGRIEASTRPEGGARFRVYIRLPVCTAAVLPTDQAADEVVGYQGRRRTLLVVDDIAEHRTLLLDMASRLGFRVIMAINGRQALDLWRRNLDDIDAILVDQRMEDGDGWWLLRQVRSLPQGDNLPTVLVSAADIARPTNLPPQLNFDAALHKPVRAADLVAILGELLALDWQRNTTTKSPEAPPPLPALPEASWCLFAEMLDMGRITAMREFADALTCAEPDLLPTCDQIKRLCDLADLAELNRLLERIKPSEPPAPAPGA